MDIDNDSKRTPVWNTVDYHRKKIVDIVDKIEDSWILWQIHMAIVNITKEDS